MLSGRRRAPRRAAMILAVVLSSFTLTGCHELYCNFVEGLTGTPLDCSHDQFPDLGDIPIPSLPPPPSLPTTTTVAPTTSTTVVASTTSTLEGTSTTSSTSVTTPTSSTLGFSPSTIPSSALSDLAPAVELPNVPTRTIPERTVVTRPDRR